MAGRIIHGGIVAGSRGFMRIFRQSLRSKLIGVFLLPTLIIVSLYGALAYTASRQGLEDELGKRLISIGETVSAEMSEGFDARQITRLDETKRRVLERMRDGLVRVRERTGVRRVYLFDSELEALVDTRDDVEFGQRLYELEAHRAEIDRTFETGESATSVLFEGPDGRLYKTGFVAVTLEDEPIAALGVEGSAEYFDLLTNFASILTLLGALSLLLVVLAATVFSRRLTRPINRLVAAARRLGRGELDEPVTEREAEEGDEIQFLAGAFEEMRRNILSRDRQMQMMLSGIAHEVRNPLGGMELFCGLLEEDLAGAASTPESESMREKVARIKQELAYLERVVDDFLDFAREAPLEQERFLAADFAEEIEHLLSGEAVAVGCELDVSIEEGVELTADRQKLRRAVINVIRNAYQACSEGGSIELFVEAPRDDTRVVGVSDDGPGIDTDMLGEVLEPFFTTREKGSGLGLALTRRIVSEHDGRLEIDSDPGAGTTVRFVLPFDDSLVEPRSDVPEGWLG